MITLIRSIVVGQYGAALRMLRGCIERADDVTWQADVGRFPFWHVVYHTLYYADLYLSPDERAFRPASFHREDYNWLGENLSAPEEKLVADRPYDKETLVAYLDACRTKAKRTMDGETEAILAGPNGFSWLEFTRLEAHLYNIRHIQHHTGQLSASLRRQHGGGAEWAYSEPL